MAVAFAVAIACFIMSYLSYPCAGLFLLAAYFSLPKTQGPAFRQSLFFTLVITFSFILAYGAQFIPFSEHLNQALIMLFLTFILINIFLNLSNFELPHSLFILVYFFFATYFMLLQFTFSLKAALICLFWGAMLGTLFPHIFISHQPFQAFKTGITPLLNAYEKNSQALIEMLTHKTIAKNLQIHLQEVDRALLQNNGYPEWIYDVGFNRGLRASFRFFLINLERLADLFKELNFYILKYDEFEVLETALLTVLQNNQLLLQSLINYFAEGKMLNQSGDFFQDVEALIALAKQHLAIRPELLEWDEVNSAKLIVIRSASDMRKILLDLCFAIQ